MLLASCCCVTFLQSSAAAIVGLEQSVTSCVALMRKATHCIMVSPIGLQVEHPASALQNVASVFVTLKLVQ